MNEQTTVANIDLHHLLTIAWEGMLTRDIALRSRAGRIEPTLKERARLAADIVATKEAAKPLLDDLHAWLTVWNAMHAT